jgi:serine/threonine protein kinase
MFTTDDLIRTATKFDEVLAKRPRPRDPSDSPIAYQSLNVVKRLSKAKFPVYLTSSKVNKQNYAMKIFSHKGEKPHPYYKNEIRFASLKHPNVIDMVYYENEKDTLTKGELKKVSYILMEYAPHGDFFDFVIKHREQIDEKLVRTYFRQLIDGIEYLHACRVAHLDLKPENLLIGADLNLKIADFDLSHVCGDGKILSRGTRYYRGPEFFRSGSSHPEIKNPFPSDIYAAGIILFILKSGGIYPHSENNTVEGVDLVDLMYNNNDEFWRKHCEIQEKKNSFYDKEFKELFNSMVKYNPDERITIKEIKKSKWYNGKVYSPNELQKKMKQILNVN